MSISNFGFKPFELSNRFIDFENILNKKLTTQNVLIATGSLATSYVMYRIVRFWLKVRRYNHLPGPPNKGYESTRHFS